MSTAPAVGPQSAPVVLLSELSFGWKPGQCLLNIPQLTVSPGERLFISGPSGSGKSTLLGLIGGVLSPRGGTVRVLGQSLGELSPARRDALRAAHIGFIFQLFNLLPYLTVLDNVILPCRFSPHRARRAMDGGRSLEDEARRLLGRLGLGADDFLHRGVTELSIGQQQRVAAARALLGQPELVIADEPTSSLDADARLNFLELLMTECQAAGSAIVFVSHDQALAARFDRRIALDTINRASGTEGRVHGTGAG